MSTDEPQQAELLIEGKWQKVTPESLKSMDKAALQAAYTATSPYCPPTEMGFEGIMPPIEGMYVNLPHFGGLLLAKQILG